MTQIKVLANTPRYVLKRGSKPISPTILHEDPNRNCVCVYGFSDKPIYDKFKAAMPETLTPYPLVERYLSNQIGSAKSNSDDLTLVILDATDDVQLELAATTMATVLLAQQQNAEKVSVEFELIFDPRTTGYRFKNIANSDESDN